MNLPTFVLGTMYYGTNIDRQTAFRMIDMYLDRGHNLLDTANNYAFWISKSRGGESESLIGEWISAGNRNRARIATKIGARPKHAGGDLSDVEGLSRKSVMSAVDESLRRLRMDSVDILYAHIDDQGVSLDESLGALNDVLETGKCQAIGLSNLVANRLDQAITVILKNDLAPISVLQQRASVIDPIAGADVSPHVIADKTVQAILKTHEIPLIAYSPLVEGAMGNVSRDLPPEYDSTANRRTREDLAAEGDSLGKSLPQMVLRTLVKDRGITPLLGARTPTQLEDALAAFD